MAKFANPSKLSPKERQRLIVYFCRALASIKSPEEAAKFLTDLISPHECEMLAKRLQIAYELSQNHTYEEISEKLKVSHGTIAKINVWLTLSGEGFKTVIKRVKPHEEKSTDIEDVYDYYSWENVSRRYHWPLALIDEIIEHSNRKQRKKNSRNYGQHENQVQTL